MNLLNNPLGVILPQAAFGLPITIIILRSFFRSIPAEVEESAVLDGCGPFRFFWRILLPMSRPALGTVSVLAVVGSWNNYLLPLIVFNDSQLVDAAARRPAVPVAVLGGHRAHPRLRHPRDAAVADLLRPRRTATDQRPDQRRRKGLKLVTSDL